MDRPRHITKEGNEMARRNLVTAANHILRDSSKETARRKKLFPGDIVTLRMDDGNLKYQVAR